MTTEAKFYRTRITLDVLSDRPGVDNLPLDVVIKECDTGDFVLGSSIPATVEVLSDKEMDDALTAAGSAPGFFDKPTEDPELPTLDYNMLVEAAKAAGLDETAIRANYSGRGMYGTCLGLVHRTINDLLGFHAALMIRGVALDRLWAREDAMGLDRITYWPAVTVEGADD